MKITGQKLLWSVVVLGLCACGVQKYEVRGNSLAPAADARIVAKIDKRQNLTNLEIDATNLTPPDRLVENGSAFVIWTRSSSKASWSRSGSLALNDEGREGRAQVRSPSRHSIWRSARRTAPMSPPHLARRSSNDVCKTTELAIAARRERDGLGAAVASSATQSR